MIKVYVVNKFWDYEGEATDSVFSTREKAELYVKNKSATGTMYCDKFNIYEIEIDKEEDKNGGFYQ